MKIAILGFGKEGKSALEFLRKQPEYKKAEFWALDREASADIPNGVSTQLGDDYLRGLSRFDMVVRSPGIRYSLPEIQDAIKKGINVTSPTKIFFEKCPTKHTIGVTGTKGKGTTSTLIYEILRSSHVLKNVRTSGAKEKDVFLVGNIGIPALSVLPRLDKDSWVVLEMSSFQLMDLGSISKVADKKDSAGFAAIPGCESPIPSSGGRRIPPREIGLLARELPANPAGPLSRWIPQSPHVAVALMVTSEHLDWHANVKEYRNAKGNIVRFQKADDFAVLAADYPASRGYAKLTKAKTFFFSRRLKMPFGRASSSGSFLGTWVSDGHFWFSDGKKKEKICATSDLQIPGEHNWENVGAAITVARLLKIPKAVIVKTLRKFKGLEHRLEFVVEKNGVRYYNDSYATTPETAIAAIRAFPTQPKILILGGSSKNSDFRELGRVIAKSKNIKAIIGIGVEWQRIKSVVPAEAGIHASSEKPGSVDPVLRRGDGIKNKYESIKIIEGCKNMREIVAAAKKIAAPGDVVLLSPACASFGMFKNYSERGEEFKTWVRK